MANSTVQLQQLIDDARCYPEIVTALPAIPGSVSQPALQIADRVMRALLAQDLPWKWNRNLVPRFIVVPLQQDYVTNVTDMAWVENGQGIDVNNTANPKPVWPVRAVRDGTTTWWQGDARFQSFTWIPNPLALTWTWQPSTTIPCGYGVASPAASPIQQTRDVNGVLLFIDSSSMNLTINSPGFSGTPFSFPSGPLSAGTNSPLCLLTSSIPVPTGTIVTISGKTGLWAAINGPWRATQISQTQFSIPVDTTLFGSFGSAGSGTFTTGPYGTTGTAIPIATSTTPGTLVQDGSVVWTVADPNAYAIRFTPIPPPGGITYVYQLWYQMKPPKFTSADQTLAPVPDEMYDVFLEGFIAYASDNSNDPKVREKAPTRKAEWITKIREKLMSFDREANNTSIVPAQSIDSRGGGSLMGVGGSSLPWPSGIGPVGAGNPYFY